MTYNLQLVATTVASRRDGATYNSSKNGKRFLIKHVGNMGDLVFFIPPILETLKRVYPDSHITFVTAWGYKDKRGRWGQRNQGGFSIHLLQTNPHIDRLVHWHDTKLSLEGTICHENGESQPTWNRAYYEKQKATGDYAGVYELDFGLTISDNPIQRMYEAINLPKETYSRYQIYLSDHDREVAKHVMQFAPHPRVVLLEGLEGVSTRGWDPDKIPHLEQAIQTAYGVAPIWFGSKYIPEYQGRPLTLRENIATLTHCDVAVGVLSGPLHFAVAVGLPTLTLFADQPLKRGAPAYFLNQYIQDPLKYHRTLLGSTRQPFQLLKDAPQALTAAEAAIQHYTEWTTPGRQATKSPLAVISVAEVMDVLQDMLATQ